MSAASDADLRHMVRQGDIGAYLKQLHRDAAAAADRRRSLVLAHPDLAAALTLPPLDHQRPEQWTGYLPPETWNGVRNDSPMRKTLAALVAEAENRTRTA